MRWPGRRGSPYADGSESEPAVVGHTVSDVLPVQPGGSATWRWPGSSPPRAALVYPAALLVVAGVAAALVLGSLLAGQRTVHRVGWPSPAW